MLKIILIILLISSASAEEIILKFDPETGIEEFTLLVRDNPFESMLGLKLEDEEFFDYPILIKTDKDFDVSHPQILKAQKNYTYKVQFPDDPKFLGEWALENDSMKKVWAEVTDCEKIPVAVLDTGVNFSHEDLVDSFWHKKECQLLNGTHKKDCRKGFNFFDEKLEPLDFHGHGTHMASLIGAVGDNSKGITGLCWKSQIMGLKVLDNFGKGTTWQIIRGIRFAVDNGAKILNLSFGRTGEEDLFLKDELTRASNHGALIVTPAGNDKLDLNKNNFWPCSYKIKGLLCVGALNQHSDFAEFSNFGDEVIDLAAPGVDLTGAGIGEIIEEELDLNIFGPGWRVLEEESNCLGTTSPTMVYPANFCEDGNKEMEIPTVKWPGDKLSLIEFKTNLQEGVIKKDFTSCVESCSLNFEGPLAIWDLKVKTIFPSKDHYIGLSGTSISSGYIAGLAALLWSYNPNFSNQDLKETLILGGRKFEHLLGKVKGGVAIWPSDNLIYLKRPKGIKANLNP